VIKPYDFLVFGGFEGLGISLFTFVELQPYFESVSFFRMMGILTT